MMIDLYSASTPNGFKISIALEEMKLPYSVITVDFEKKEQFLPKFLALSPNGRIPAIFDRENKRSVFESGAILIYLAEKTGTLLPKNGAERTQVFEWLMFQMANVGPMMGQAGVFSKYFEPKIDSVIKRYRNESLRIYGVLNTKLAEKEYVAGDFYSIADIAIYPWLCFADWCGVPCDDFSHVRRWMSRIGSRPSVIKGMNIPQNVNNEDRLRRAKAITTQ